MFLCMKNSVKVLGCCHCMISRGIGVVFGFLPSAVFEGVFTHRYSPAFTPPITSLGISFFSIPMTKAKKLVGFNPFFTFMYLSITPHHTICIVQYIHQRLCTYFKALSRDFTMRTVKNVHWSSAPTHIYLLHGIGDFDLSAQLFK